MAGQYWDNRYKSGFAVASYENGQVWDNRHKSGMPVASQGTHMGNKAKGEKRCQR